jgi:hypothetical protein
MSGEMKMILSTGRRTNRGEKADPNEMLQTSPGMEIFVYVETNVDTEIVLRVNKKEANPTFKEDS